MTELEFIKILEPMVVIAYERYIPDLPELDFSFEVTDSISTAMIRIRGKVARTTFKTDVSGLSRDKGIIPDYYVEPDIEDITKDNDTTRECVLKMISEKNRN